jgi:hypothetical protein
VRRPTFLVLGAGKCGTTSLHYLLGQHPDVFTTPEKEPPFFDAEYERGLEYYWTRYFSAWKGESAAGESRPAKLYLPFVPHRIRAALPGAKLIVILRNPVDRLFSHWAHRYRESKERLPLAEALAAEDRQGDAVERLMAADGPAFWRSRLTPDQRSTWLRTYRPIGRYAEQLLRYFALFPGERIRVVRFEAFRDDPVGVVRELWRFLGVDNPEAPLDEVSARNPAMSIAASRVSRRARRTGLFWWPPTGARRAIRAVLDRIGPRPRFDPDVRAELVEYYRPHNRRLEQLLDWDLSDWDS